MKGVAILGATGSIGRSTLAVIEAHPDAYRVVSLAARSDVTRMLEVCLRHRPEVAVMEQPEAASELERRLRKAGAGTRVAAGGAAIEELASDAAADITGQVFVVFAGRLHLMEGWTMVGEIEQGERWSVEAIDARRNELFGDRRTGAPRMGFGR